MTLDFIQNPKHLKALKERQRVIDNVKLTELKKNAFLKDQIINHSRIDLLMREVLGYTSVMDFHLLMFYHNTNCYKKVEKQKWHLLLAPRGSGKSSCITISKIILDILQNPNIRILIASKTDSNAIAFLSEIKQKIQSKKFKTIFGDLIGRIWNDGAIVVKNRTASHKEETVSTVGYTGALASKHFDKIYADDLVDEENSKTDTQRQKLYTWFYKILDPTLEPDGEMNIIGTRYHPNDLYGTLIESVFTKKNSKGKVLKRYYIRIKALLKKQNLKNKHKLKEHQKYISFWPEKFSVKFLLKKKRDQGSIIFNSQYMNDVKAMVGKIFKVDWFNWYKLEDVDIKKLMVFQGVDLAIKQKDDADKFSHVTIGVDPKTFNIFVLNYYNRITHYTDQKKVIYEKYNRYDPIRVGIEANGYQEALLQDMRSDKDLSKVTAIPVFTEIDKTMRAWKLSAYFERGQVFFLEGMHELQEHLLQMPDGRYKDLFDALDIAIRVAFRGKKKTRNKEPGLI